MERPAARPRAATDRTALAVRVAFRLLEVSAALVLNLTLVPKVLVVAAAAVARLQLAA